MVKQILKVSNIVLITVSVMLGVQIFYGVVTARLDEKIISAELKKEAGMKRPSGGFDKIETTVKNSYSSYESIVQRDLFKTKAHTPSEVITAAPVIEALEKTTLKLKLWGTITGNGEGAYAVIEDTSNRRQSQQLYRVGDNIGDANIKHILREKVILTVAGRDEVLEMEHLLESTDRAVASGRGTDSASLAEAQEVPGQEFSIQRDTIENAVSDIGNLMRQVRIRPYFEDGNPEGVLLSGIRRDSIFEEMGLKSGDILKGVNGNPIRSVDDAMELYQELRSSHNVQLQIERDGSSQSISYRIN